MLWTEKRQELSEKRSYWYLWYSRSNRLEEVGLLRESCGTTGIGAQNSDENLTSVSTVSTPISASSVHQPGAFTIQADAFSKTILPYLPLVGFLGSRVTRAVAETVESAIDVAVI